jgi:transposase-like protein
MSILSKKYFHDEASAFEYVESIIWPEGPVCPHCGCLGRIYPLKGVRTKPSKKHPEGKERHGLKKCGDCRKQFTVRKGTIFEESHLELHLWLQAIYLLCSSKKGISSNQIHRTLGVTLKTAWFLSHRIREAMRSGDLVPFGSGGGPVEVDETFIGSEPGRKKKRGAYHKMKVLTLVDRDSGRAKSVVIDDLKVSTIAPILVENISQEALLVTDDAPRYIPIGHAFSDHQSVNHSIDEYVRPDDRTITTNTVENYFSVFKRGMKGVYQHCAKKHLHRYMAEYDFRYNLRSVKGVNDEERTAMALVGIVGKRLTYERVSPTV